METMSNQNAIRDAIKNIVGSKINKIEVIGHKKSMKVELVLHCTDEASYRQIYDTLSMLDLNGLIDYALTSFNMLKQIGMDEQKLDLSLIHI